MPQAKDQEKKDNLTAKVLCTSSEPTLLKGSETCLSYHFWAGDEAEKDCWVDATKCIACQWICCASGMTDGCTLAALTPKI